VGDALANDRTVSVSDIEDLLICLPGVQKARVVINDWGAIEEIHILTGLERHPKQIVRDVQSALKAQWDITLDRRKVSVAQIKGDMRIVSGRLKYTQMEIKADAESGKSMVAVTLTRGKDDDCIAYTGKSIADSTEFGTLLGIAKATCLACNEALEPPNAFFVEDVCTSQVGDFSTVIVLLNLVTPRRHHQHLVGSALVRRDARESCVRATLDAMNRRMEVLPQRGVK
jgi:hypothetical protein